MVGLVDPGPDADRAVDVVTEVGADATVFDVLATETTTDRIGGLADPELRARLAPNCRIHLPPGGEADARRLAERVVPSDGSVERFGPRPGPGPDHRGGHTGGRVARLTADVAAVPLAEAGIARRATASDSVAIDVRVRDPQAEIARPWSVLFPGDGIDGAAVKRYADGRDAHHRPSEWDPARGEERTLRAWETRTRVRRRPGLTDGYHATAIDLRDATPPPELLSAATAFAYLDEPSSATVENLREAGVDAAAVPERNGWTWAHVGGGAYATPVVVEPQRGDLDLPDGDRIVDDLDAGDGRERGDDAGVTPD